MDSSVVLLTNHIITLITIPNTFKWLNAYKKNSWKKANETELLFDSSFSWKKDKMSIPFILFWIRNLRWSIRIASISQIDFSAANLFSANCSLSLSLWLIKWSVFSWLRRLLDIISSQTTAICSSHLHVIISAGETSHSAACHSLIHIPVLTIWQWNESRQRVEA